MTRCCFSWLQQQCHPSSFSYNKVSASWLSTTSPSDKNNHNDTEAAKTTTTINKKTTTNELKHIVEHRAKEKSVISLSQKLAEQVVSKHGTEIPTTAVRTSSRIPAKDNIVKNRITPSQRIISKEKVSNNIQSLIERIISKGRKIKQHIIGKTSDHVMIPKRIRQREAVIGSVEKFGKRQDNSKSQLVVMEKIFDKTAVVKTSTTGKFKERMLNLSMIKEKIIIRIGRGCMIILPIMGGIFALYLFQSDYQRLKEEQIRLNSMLLSSSSSSSSCTQQQQKYYYYYYYIPLICFGGAGMMDLIDSIIHFNIAYYGLYYYNESHHTTMVLLEQISVSCAISSTIFAIGGEITSNNNNSKKTENKEKEE